MERAIRAIMGAIAGVFIMMALFQVFLVMPEASGIVNSLIEGVYNGLIIGAIVIGIIGIIVFYLAIKER